MSDIIARGIVEFRTGAAQADPDAARPRLTLLDRYGAWLQRRADAARLREIDPRLARDIGSAPGLDCAPEGFAVDPRPLWGIGQTPQPMDVVPPWSGNRRSG